MVALLTDHAMIAWVELKNRLQTQAEAAQTIGPTSFYNHGLIIDMS